MRTFLIALAYLMVLGSLAVIPLLSEAQTTDFSISGDSAGSISADSGATDPTADNFSLGGDSSTYGDTSGTSADGSIMDYGTSPDGSPSDRE